MRSFVLAAAATALVIAALDGCARPVHPLRPRKEPHAQTAAAAWTGRAFAMDEDLGTPPPSSAR